MALLEFDADDEELQLFLAETNDHLQALDQNIVKLETHPDDHALLQNIFRSAHTIKGGAGLIGHQRMAVLSHHMENVLECLRSRTLSVTPAIIDALLAALDALRVLNHEVVTRVPSELPLDGIMAALEACLAPGSTQAASAPAPIAPAAAPAPALTVVAPIEEQSDLADWVHVENLEALLGDAPPSQLYDVAVTVDPACGLSAARTLQAYMNLNRTTRVLVSMPTPQEIEADDTVSALKALVVTQELPSLLEHRLAGIADVMAVRVAAVAMPDRRKNDRRQGAPDAMEAARALAEKPLQQETSIRISVGILDDLMSLVSELVLGRTRLQTLRNQLQGSYCDDDRIVNLGDAVGHLDRISNDLQATVMKARMLPVENVFQKFPRLMRDLAAQKGKQITFTMRGQETELDRSVIEQLSDPLIHLLRNAVDHGMEEPAARVAAGKPETGAITLSATPCENHILIEVADDGYGIDPARVKASAVAKGILSAEAAERLSDREAQELVFAAGLSTAKAITDISGRGVGMDIVKSTIERMGGHIQIESTLGQGTTFSITLPLTLAIMQALLVSVDGAVYALPLNMVTEILSVPRSDLQMLQGTEATLLRGTILPIVRLREYFGCPPDTTAGQVNIVATRVDGQLLGLAVDSFIGEQEIVMKPLGTYMGTIPGLAGATILGDGRIGLLVDVAALKNWSPAPSLAAIA